MTESNKPANQPTAPAAPSGRGENILGLPTQDLAGLSVDEITGNKVAITMIMHYYKQLVDENGSLRNDLNTLKTYIDGYRSKKQDSTIAGRLQFLASVLIGFGVNLLTADVAKPAGWIMLSGGVLTQVFGLYYSQRSSQ